MRGEAFGGRRPGRERPIQPDPPSVLHRLKAGDLVIRGERRGCAATLARMSRFLSVDLLAGLGAIAWAVLGMTVLPELGELMDSKVAGGFGVAALGRWYVVGKKKAKALEAAAPEPNADESEKPEDA